MKYKNLLEVLKAQKKGELKEPLMLDNDYSFISTEEETLYSGLGPEYLLREALDLLGIKWDSV